MIASKVSAQSLAITTYRLPEGQQLTVGEETFQCYTLGEFQSLLRLDIDAHAYQQSLVSQQEISRLRASQLQATREALRLSDAHILELDAEIVRLREMYLAENRKRLEAEASPNILGWVGWGFAAVSAVVAVALGVTLAITGM